MRPPYPPYVLDRIKAIAQDSPCEEVGGVVVATPGAFRVVSIENCSAQPDCAYIPYGKGLIESCQLGHLKFYWHTHVNGNPNFSPSDITGIWETEIPWLLYDLKNDTFNYFDPELQTPLLRRPWELGLTDCWAVVRDFYRWHLGIILPPPEHEGIPRPWTNPLWNRPLERLPAHFDHVPIQTIQSFDIVLYKNPAPNYPPAHFGVLVPTELGLELLHHFYKQPSVLTADIKPDRIHSIWRSKCPISPSDSSALWGVNLGAPTALEPPDLVRVSAFSVTSLRDSSKPS
jgi:proteasome lid subunit RPN8/RPN11